MVIDSQMHVEKQYKAERKKLSMVRILEGRTWRSEFEKLYAGNISIKYLKLLAPG